MKKKIGWGIVILILPLIAWNVFSYISLKNRAEQVLRAPAELGEIREPVDLTGLMDSFGVPYSPSVEKDFMDILEESFREQGMLGSSLDLYNLYVNKTWEVEGILRNPVTIGELTEMQNFGMDFVRHKYGERVVRSDLRYAADPEVSGKSLPEYLGERQNPVILYSCTANDLFYYFGFSPENLTPKKTVEMLKNAGHGIRLLETDVEGNLEALSNCHPGCPIFVMGLYVPSDHFLLQRFGGWLVGRVNRVIEKACGSFENVHYVDVSCLCFHVLEGDFHPDADGQKILAGLLAEAIRTWGAERAGGVPAEDEEKVSAGAGEDQSAETVPSDAGTEQDLSLEELKNGLEHSGVPQRDYVECAVAIEALLEELGREDCSAEVLEKLLTEIQSDQAGADAEGSRERLDHVEQALRILWIERKIHTGFDLRSYSLNPDVRNDKLSLLDYMR